MPPIYQKVKDFVADESIICDEVDLLPFCHITNGYSFQDIIYDGVLKGKSCPVLNKKAVFFFYGKPQFIPSEDAVSVMGGQSPVCILYEYDDIKDNDITIFPFDSGGYKRYEAPDNWNIEDFILCSEKNSFDWSSSLKRYIKKMYGSNLNYLNISIFEDNKENVQFHYTLKFIVQLNESPEKLIRKKYGQQATTIEVQIQSESIKLNPKIIFLPISEYTGKDSGVQLQHVKEIEDKYNLKTKMYQDNPWSLVESYTSMKKATEEYILDTYK